MQQVLDWLNDPTIKTVLMFFGGLVLKKWSGFVNKFIPVALLGISILLAALKALFPMLVPDAEAATVTAAVVSVPWWKWLLVDVLVPVLLAVGAHSSVKNTTQGIQGR